MCLIFSLQAQEFQNFPSIDGRNDDIVIPSTVNKVRKSKIKWTDSRLPDIFLIWIKVPTGRPGLLDISKDEGEAALISFVTMSTNKRRPIRKFSNKKGLLKIFSVIDFKSLFPFQW